MSKKAEKKFGVKFVSNPFPLDVVKSPSRPKDVKVFLLLYCNFVLFFFRPTAFYFFRGESKNTSE